MANLIIKSSADNLVLQGSDASPAITVGATGTTTFAENLTLSGTANNLGTSTAGTLTSGITYPAGHVVNTSQVHDRDVASHINTTSDAHAASGITLSTPACTGSNYNIITFSSGSYSEANALANVILYANKNGAGYSQVTGASGNQAGGIRHYYSDHRFLTIQWVDNNGLTAGTNIYQIYFRTASSTFYLVHSGNDYQFVVQEIQA